MGRSVWLKTFFFDKQAAQALFDPYSRALLRMFGETVRRKARALVGAPTDPRTKPRPPGKPPRARRGFVEYRRQRKVQQLARDLGLPVKVKLKEQLSLRSVQYYFVQNPRLAIRIEPVPISNPKQPAVPDVHEFGMTITMYTTRKPDGSELFWNVVPAEDYEVVQVRMPKRPYMRPAFEYARAQLPKLIAKAYEPTRRRGR